MRSLLCWTAITVFILFAALQLNDPDPILWVPIYGYAAWCVYTYWAHRVDRTLYSVGLLGYMAGAIQLFPPSIKNWIGNEQKAKGLEMSLPWIEEARESMGLAICAFAMLVLLWQTRLNKARV